MKKPLKYTYILNDNNPFLIQLYETAKDKNKLKDLIKNLNEIAKDINKEKYNIIIKEKSLIAWIIKNKIYNIRPGLYPVRERATQYNFDYLESCPIVGFLRTEKIIFKNIDGIILVNKYKNNDKAFIFLDPPYLKSCNDFYLDASTNVYEFLYHNKINTFKSYLCLCLEDNWIIKLLFNGFIIDTYAKKYESGKKRTTTHIIITNRE